MDLEKLVSRDGWTWKSKEQQIVRGPCPICSGGTATIRLLGGSLIGFCTSGCDKKALLGSVTDPSDSGAAAPSLNVLPAVGPSTNGNGKVHHPDVRVWRALAFSVGQKFFEKAAGNKPALLAGTDQTVLIAQLSTDLVAGVDAGILNPLPDLSRTDLLDEVETVSTAVIQDFLDSHAVTEAPTQNGHGPLALPEVFIRKQIEVLTWGELRTRRQSHVQNWAVEGWLSLGEVSMWSGKVEHGKTTLMRELTLCKVRGEAFLGRPCAKGRVFYAMLDADGENLTYDEFEKMGMNDGDRENIRFMFEPMLARMERGPEQFFAELWQWRPEIVIIDPFARLQEIGDFNDYNNTYLMAMLSQYAKTLNAHFALPGHIPRGRPQGSSAATAAFGSIAFGGGVNARFVVERKEGTDVHVLRTSKGKSAGFEAIEGDHVLERDVNTGRISLGKAFSFGHQASAIKGRVLDLINGAGLQDWTPFSIAKELGTANGLVRAALGMLFDDKKINRVGAGKKGNPYVYSKRLEDCPIPAVDLPERGLFGK